MTDELKPVCCGCGGEAVVGYTESGLSYVECQKCLTETRFFHTEAEAITAWNKAMGERTAKVRHHLATIKTYEGFKYRITEDLCGNCKRKVLPIDVYCSECGARLERDE